MAAQLALQTELLAGVAAVVDETAAALVALELLVKDTLAVHRQHYLGKAAAAAAVIQALDMLVLAALKTRKKAVTAAREVHLVRAAHPFITLAVAVAELRVWVVMELAASAAAGGGIQTLIPFKQWLEQQIQAVAVAVVRLQAGLAQLETADLAL